MSTTVDERVVSMQFDNRNFEKNVQTSMGTLDKLKNSLNLSGAAKGLESVGSAARGINMSPLGAGIEAVQAKFSALGVMAVTTLANITNSAVNAGKNMIKALTIDPIMSGFREYETQINAVQTILANTESKGTTLQNVNAALDELNTYADKTIYNFTEMTRNIGTFTAAGVDLDVSVQAIKGIANLAAVSGSNAQQASTAMYQLSQALASGTVKLMDWNSVVNAGMGGQVFQDALKETARVHDIAIDDMITKNGSFRETLQEGWLTAEILTETLSKFTGDLSEEQLKSMGYTDEQIQKIIRLGQMANDAATKVKTFTQLFDTLKEAAQSGWTQTWEILIGDFGEAKETLTEMSDVIGGIIGRSAEARNAVLSEGLSSGWKQLLNHGISDETGYIESIVRAANNGETAISGLGETVIKLSDNMSTMSEEELAAAGYTTAMAEEFKRLSDGLRDGSVSIDDLASSFGDADMWATTLEQGLKDGTITSDTMSTAVANLAEKMSNMSAEELEAAGYSEEMATQINELKEGLANGSISMEEFTSKITKLSGRENLIQALWNSFKGLMSVIAPIKEAFREIFPPITGEQVYSLTEKIREFTDKLAISGETADKIKRIFKGVFSIFDILRQAVIAVAKPFLTFLGADEVSSFAEMLLNAAAAVGDFFTKLNEGIKTGDGFSVVGEGITTVLGYMADALDFVSDKFDSFGGVMSIIGSAISTVFSKVKDILSDVFGWINENISAGDIFAGLAGGGIFLAAKKFSDLIGKIKDIFDGFGGGGGDDSGGIKDRFSDILSSVNDSLRSFQEGIKVASLLGIAGAVMLLSSALRTISEIEPYKMAYSLGAIGALLLMLSGSFKTLTKTLSKFDGGGTIKAAIAMIAMAKAVDILAEAMTKIAALSFEEVVKGLAGVGGLLLELSLAMKLMNGTKVNLRTSIAILAVAYACKILASALTEFSKLSWDEIARGLTAMGGALAELVIVLAVLSKVGGGGALLGGVALLIAVQSLDEISKNLELLGDLSWEQIGKGLTAMGGALAELTIVLSILSKVGGFGAILGGAALLIAVQSLDEISENLERLGNLSWEQIGKGLTAMGGALAELGITIGLLGKLTGLSGLVGAASILLAAQSLDEIAGCLERIGGLSWEEIAKGLVGMGGALIELGVITGLLGKLTGLSGLVGAGTIVLAVQALDPLAEALIKFGSMTWDEIGRGLVAMGGALAELAIVCGGLGFLTGVAGLVGAGTILLASQGLDDIANALIKFGSMSWDEIGRGLAAMGGALGEVALGGLLNTFSGFGAKAISEVAKPLGDLADSVKKWKDVTVPEGLGAQLGNLASGVLAFTFGGWGAGAISEVAAPLGTLADSVNKWVGVTVPDGLGTQLSELATGVKSFTFGGWGAGAIAEVATPLGTLADSVNKWVGVVVPDGLGTQLSELAAGVKSFTFGELGASAIAEAVTPLGDLAGSVIKWVGVTVPDGLKTQLTDLAAGVKSFTFGGLGAGTIAEIITPLGDLADSVTKWVGVTVPDGLGLQLEGLAAGVKKFTFGGSGASSLAEVAKPLGDLADSVTKWVGVTVPEELSTQLSSLSSSIKSFTFGGSGAGVISEVAKPLGDLADSVKKWYNVVIPEGLKDDLTGMSDGLKTFQNVNLDNLAADAIDTAIDNVKKLLGLMTDMLNTDTSGISSFSSAMDELGSISVDGFVSAFSEAGPKVQSAINSLIEIATSSISSSSQTFVEAGKSLTLALNSGILSGKNNNIDSLNSILNSLVETVNGEEKSFKSSGEGLVNSFSEGFSSNFSGCISAISTGLLSCVSAISSYYSRFLSLGKYLVMGFAEGINLYTYLAEIASGQMAWKAYQAARVLFHINSPSLLFRDLGHSVVEGLTQGIARNTCMAEDASTEMAESVVTSAKNALSKVTAAINNSSSIKPSIVPVIDMSNVQLDRIQLGAGIKVDLDTSVNSIASIMYDAQSAINTSNNRVIQAIADLRNDVNTLATKEPGETNLYVNGKKLASSISKDINRELNILSKRGAYI